MAINTCVYIYIYTHMYTPIHVKRVKTAKTDGTTILRATSRTATSATATELILGFVQENTFNTNIAETRKLAKTNTTHYMCNHIQL